jgi:hypothetical protein
MMADLARIKRNVIKMVGLSAPEADIDAYIASEGVSIDDVRAFKGTGITQLQGKVADLPSRQPQPPQLLAPDLMTSTAATVNGLVNSVPFLQNISDAVIGTGAQLTGGDYGQTVQGLQAKREQIAQSAPIARMAGEVGGALGLFGAGAGTKLGAEALGMTGNIGKQMLNAGLSSAGYSGLMGISEGKQGAELLGDMATGGAIGTVSPVLGAGIRAAGRGINNNIIRPIATMANRDNEAIARVGRAVGMDRAAGGVMSSADEAVAASAGAPVINADRFGSATRTLARTAANISPEAQGTLQGTVQDRFLTQGRRAKSFVSDLMNGAVDDLALQDGLRQRATQVNNKAYDAAKANPASRAIWNEPIRELMESPTFRSAISDAERLGADRAAVAGVKAVRNPFQFADDGTVTLRVNPDGSRALPSLDFWDQVKRNLDVLIEKAKPTPIGGGSRTEFNDLSAIKRKLVSALDAAVPEYQTARQGAAKFFGADDALEAGRKAFNMTKSVPELRKAHFAMSGPERDAAAVGYASEMIDTIDASKDRLNVINSLFGSESARARNALFLGPERAKQLEAYVKVEQTLDLLRNAVSGNSTTAQQLIASGVLGGAGGAIGFIGSGGDLGSAGGLAFLTMAGRRGMQLLGKSVDDQVMKRVAEMLVSNDPKMVERAIELAVSSKVHMEALDALMKGIELAGRGAALSAVN